MSQRILLALLVPVATVAGLWTGGSFRSPAHSGPQKNPPVLVIDQYALNLGEVWEDQAFQRSIKVENKGSETVRVEGASCACTGLKIEPPQFDLSPGASREVRVTLNLSNPPGNGPAPRPLSAALHLRYSTPGKDTAQDPVGEFHGTVKPALLAQPVWNLGICSKASGPIERHYEIVAATPLASLDVDIPPNPWRLQVMVRPRADRAGVYNIHVRAADPAATGSLHTEVLLRPRTADGTPIPPKPIVVEAEVSATDARTAPTELYFGGARMGTVVESRVVVTAISGQEVRVERVEPSGPDLEVFPVDGVNEFRVKQRVMRVGAISNTVWFSVHTKTGVERVSLPVEVVGVEPAP